MKKMRGIVALCVALTLGLGSSALLAQKDDNKKPEVKRTKAEQVDIDTLVDRRRCVAAGRVAAPSRHRDDVGIEPFLPSARTVSTVMPFTVTVDKASSRRRRRRAVCAADRDNRRRRVAAAATAAGQGQDKDKAARAPSYAWENIYFTTMPPDGKSARATSQVQARRLRHVRRGQGQGHGREEQDSMPKIGVLQKDAHGSRLQQGELTTSSDRRSAIEQSSRRPPANGRGGPVRVRPAACPVDGRQVARRPTLDVVFWVYNAGLSTLTSKPDVQVEYSFNQKTADGEKFFNKTQPQALNSQSPYNVAMGIPNFLEVPLVSFAPGDYRLEIKITDKPSGKMITQNVNFTVAAS